MDRKPTPDILSGAPDEDGDPLVNQLMTTGGDEAYDLAFDRMVTAIAQAHRVDDVKDIRDRAEALRQYAKQVGESLRNQNRLAEIKLRAERRAGELLVELERGQTPGTGRGHIGEKSLRHDVASFSEYRTTLTGADIEYRTAQRWQQIATIPEEVFEASIAEITQETDDRELTSAYMLRLAQQVKRDRLHAGMDAPPELPEGKFRVFYADPPWKYGNAGVIGESDNYGHAARHYPSMSIAELCGLGGEVKSIADDNAVLFMWVTSPLLEECFDVIRAWGFEYKTSFVWDKIAHNFGHYNSVRHELLLICTRGSCTPDALTLYDSVISIERTRHSEKPEQFREMIDNLYTWGSRIELFARAEAPGWERWGNE